MIYYSYIGDGLRNLIEEYKEVSNDFYRANGADELKYKIKVARECKCY